MRDVERHHALPSRCTWCSHGRPHQTSRPPRNRSVRIAKIENVRWAATRTRPNTPHNLCTDRTPNPLRPMPSRSHHTMAPHPKHLRQQRCTPLRQTQSAQRTRLPHLERRRRPLEHPTPRRHRHCAGCLTDPLRAELDDRRGEQGFTFEADAAPGRVEAGAAHHTRVG